MTAHFAIETTSPAHGRPNAGETRSGGRLPYPAGGGLS